MQEEFREAHRNIFEVFGFSQENANKQEVQRKIVKERKNIYNKELQTNDKRRKVKSFWVFFL